MKQMNPPGYSDRDKVELLKMAPLEKLMEYILLAGRRDGE